MTEDAPNDLLDLVAAEIKAAHAANIPPPDQPTYITDRLRVRLSGCNEYVRKRKKSPATCRAEILLKFNGRNGAELAKEYDYSLRRIQQIVAKG